MTLVVNGTTGISLTAGNIPSFSAYRSTVQSIPNGVYTLMQLTSEEFDTANAFDSTTNFRFQPPVAGYYSLEGQVLMGPTSTGGNIFGAIFKNGAMAKRGSSAPNNATDGGWVTVASTMYLNGSTDYVDLRVYQGSTAALNTAPANAGAENRFSGTLVRPDQVFPVGSPVTTNNGPAFRVRTITAQTVTSNLNTKVQFNVKDFDTNNLFDATTNFRFQPNVSGYYHFDWNVQGQSAAGSGLQTVISSLWKNGVMIDANDVMSGSYIYPVAVNEGASTGSDVIFLNGSTDYIELFSRIIGTGTLTIQRSRFAGYLVRQ